MTPAKLQAARLRAARRYPYLASALMRMQMVPSTDCAIDGHPTMAVDSGWRCYYHPDFLENSLEVIETILIHELYHLLRNHHTRRGSRDPLIWNIATDCEINDDLIEAGHSFKELNVPLPQKLGLPKGKLAEEYYEALTHQRASKNGQGQGGSHAKGGSPEQSSSKNPSEHHDPPQKSDPSHHQAPSCHRSHGQNPQDGANPDPPFGGSCADGIPRPWELPEPAVSTTEAELIRKEVARQILQHQQTYGQGSVPASLARWAHQQLEPPKVNWRHELRTYLQRAIAYRRGMVDYSYRYPNRRYRGEVILPGLVSPQPEIAVIIDTSGSMSNQQLTICLSELNGILKTTGYGVTVLTADAQVHTVQRIWNNPQKVQLIGGGGTDMKKAIEFATTKLKPKPHIIIVLTDGLTPWPHKKPHNVEIIVALVGRKTHIPEWAKVVEVEQ